MACTTAAAASTMKAAATTTLSTRDREGAGDGVATAVEPDMMERFPSQQPALRIPVHGGPRRWRATAPASLLEHSAAGGRQGGLQRVEQRLARLGQRGGGREVAAGRALVPAAAELSRDLRHVERGRAQ